MDRESVRVFYNNVYFVDPPVCSLRLLHSREGDWQNVFAMTRFPCIEVLFLCILLFLGWIKSFVCFIQVPLYVDTKSICGLIDDVKDLLFHHLLLIARHYIYTCRLGNKLPKLQVYIQVLMNSIEIEKQIAFHNNDSNVFVRKWSRFKNNLSQNLLH